MGRGRGSGANKSNKKPKKQSSKKSVNRAEVEATTTPEEDESVPSTSTAAATPRIRKNVNVTQLPTEIKTLRACMICSLIKTEPEFEEFGCDNCESVLQLAGTGAVNSFTSENFEGMIGALDMKTSWVAKWQRISHFKPGMYAVNVRGEPALWVKDELKDAGLTYVCRDKTIQNQNA